MTVGEADEPGRGGARAARVGALSLALTAGAVAVYLQWISGADALASPMRVPWPVLLCSFAAAEIFVIHLHLRRQAHSFSLSEVPLVIGLVFSAPLTLIAMRIVGGLSALVLHRRQSGVKLAFNGAHLALETCLAVAMFRVVLGPASPMGWRGTLAAFVVTIATDLLAATYLSAAIALYERRFERRLLREAFTQGVVLAAINTSLALLAVTVLWYAPGSAWLLVVVAGLAVLAYRSHNALGRGFARLEALYAFTRDITAEDDEDVVRGALERCRDLLRCDAAELVLVAADREGFQHVRVGPPPVVAPCDGDLGHLNWARSSLDGSPVLLRREHGAPGPRDGLAAPLRVDGVVVGVLTATDRSDDVSTFEPEDLRLLETLANHIAIALEKVNLIGRLRAEAAEKEHQALHDPLTGLPNRRHFQQAIDRALGSSPAAFAVALMDLDRFKEVNDTLGHQVGDQLLSEVGGRLRDHVGHRGVVARLGGDEFAVLFTGTTSMQALADARHLLAALDRSLPVGGLSLKVAASVGVAIAPDHGLDAGILLQRADIAMYEAKASSAGAAVYDPRTDQHSRRRLDLLNDLDEAITNGELVVHYQPKVAVSSRTLAGVEALVRWPHPTHGMVPPTEFIPLAEHSGLIRPLTMFVLETALRSATAWRGAGLHVPVAVNLSIHSLLDATIIDDVACLLTATNTRPADLTLELTETMVMSDPNKTLEILHRLSALGVRLSVDDFGTGHSSLSYLSRLPVHEVKIDKSFVMPMAESSTDAAIVRSVIELGHNLGLSVTAEGVEDEDIYSRLMEMGCDVAQGYLLGRPAPAGDLVTGRWARGPAPTASQRTRPPRAPRTTRTPVLTPEP